ncbi:hypothetical protein [Paenibacillus sp. J2TS4]|uniref:hypothetical protein n=1 Tax=Paenibacillus sp. J2TS4 TaxID=2807194 RepID=UPI001B229D34|nr:hypothetical protein [Paenibacillus sp. J2TS4]GIP33097.1 hypothetical protein J2TS4_23070 [Paenibacillus sp. J2TS4]
MSASRHRSFWSGLGSGLVAGALLLQVMNIAVNSESPSRGGDIGDVEAVEIDWKERAEEAGFAIYPADVKLYTQTELDEQLRLAQARAAAEEQGTEAPADSESAAESPDVTVAIVAGMLASDVAAALETAGVIEDSHEFELRLKELKKTPKIRSGTYSFPPGESIDAIIDRISFE